ncbi:Type-1 restriction enzyme R protein, partial [Metamycoplasma alkalescens]
MNQIMNKVESFHSIADANMFINGERVLIKRTNQDDIDNFNKEIYLKIFGKKEINAGDSIYQIARQVKIKTMLGDRILDLVLLVNGMPFFHIELKNENLHINNAIRQLKNYSEMGLYSRFFKLVQVLVAMKPNQMFYMPNTYKPSNINQTSFLVW